MEEGKRLYVLLNLPLENLRKNGMCYSFPFSVVTVKRHRLSDGFTILSHF